MVASSISGMQKQVSSAIPSADIRMLSRVSRSVRMEIQSQVGVGIILVRLWDAQTGTLHGILEGHTDWVNSVVFSSDGNTIASGSKDTTIHLWDVETGALENTLKGHADEVWSVSFSPDGKNTGECK